MDPYERSKIADALNEHKFKEGEYVIKEGEIGDKFFIIIDGEAIATKVLQAGQAPQKVLEYKKGDYFGERALLTNESRAANIISTVSSYSFIMIYSLMSLLLQPLRETLSREFSDLWRIFLREIWMSTKTIPRRSSD